MALTTTGSRSRPAPRHLLATFLLVAVVVAAGVGTGHVFGWRLNLQTRSIPVPTAAASPEDVVRIYVEAYNHRDFATMKTIYPSAQSGFSRYRAMGTMRDLRITQGGPASGADLSGTFPQAGHSYYRVAVTLDHSGLTGSDLAYDPGPNGWTYWLERSAASEPWTITDHGNG